MNTHSLLAVNLSALLTPIVAILGFYIAYRQWLTAQNKLKLDLFDRRFKIYDATLNLIGSIKKLDKAYQGEIRQYSIAQQEAKWLLNEEISNYLKEIYDKALEFQTLSNEIEGITNQQKIEGIVDDQERTKKIKKQGELVTWFYAQNKEIDKKFSKFLTLQH